MLGDGLMTNWGDRLKYPQYEPWMVQRHGAPLVT